VNSIFTLGIVKIANLKKTTSLVAAGKRQIGAHWLNQKQSVIVGFI